MKTRNGISEKLSILVFCNAIYPDLSGGAEIQLFHLCNNLARRGHRVFVMAPSNSSSDLRKQKFSSTPFKKNIAFDCRYLDLWPKPFRILSYILKSLIFSLKLRKQIDVIHVHTADYPMIPAFFFSLFNHKPYIVACRGSDIRLSSKKFLRRALQLPFLRNAKTLLTVSDEMADLLKKKYGICRHKILVIKNAYDDRIIKPVTNKVQAEKLGSKRIICVANLRPEKDHMTLLKGFKLVTESMDGVQLVLIGDGFLRKQLEDFCIKHGLKNVQFLGTIPFSDVLENVAKSDVFILTSVEEAMPNAVIEALSLGRPVIATRVGGIPEIVEDEFNGLLIPPKSPKMVAKAIKRLLKDERLYSNLASNALKSVYDRSWSKTILRYEKVYAQAFESSDE
jgi:glycosyltransferase involved in cell wall biosynthesis